MCQNVLRIQQIISILLVFWRSYFVLLHNYTGCMDIERCLIHVEGYQPNIFLERFWKRKGLLTHPTLSFGFSVLILYAPNLYQVGSSSL